MTPKRSDSPSVPPQIRSTPRILHYLGGTALVFGVLALLASEARALSTTVSSTDTPLELTLGGGGSPIQSTISVPTLAPIIEVTLQIDLTVGVCGTDALTLSGPGGVLTIMTGINHNAGNINLTVDQDAFASADGECLNGCTNGIGYPEVGTLDVFNGQNPDAGDWTLAMGTFSGSCGPASINGWSLTFETLAAQGEACSVSGDCLSGPCVDAVCCDNTCGGDGSADCQVCSVALGASVDGTCMALADATTCDDGNNATGADVCQSATCVGTPCTCSQLSACCDGCFPINQAGVCDDGDACTTTDTCAAGSCLGSNPVTCTALDACHVAGICDPASGTCPNPNVPDDTVCDDEDAATGDDHCVNGMCVAEACTCAGTGNCCDGCFPINEAGQCDDANVCTTTDTCAAGACFGSDPAICTALDACHVAGICDSASGCPNTAAPDGTVCDDGDATTGDDHCVNGMCVAEACSCDGAGACCDGCFPINQAGVCDDGDDNTTADTCTAAGVCVGGEASGGGGGCSTTGSPSKPASVPWFVLAFFTGWLLVRPRRVAHSS